MYKRWFNSSADSRNEHAAGTSGQIANFHIFSSFHCTLPDKHSLATLKNALIQTCFMVFGRYQNFLHLLKISALRQTYADTGSRVILCVFIQTNTLLPALPLLGSLENPEFFNLNLGHAFFPGDLVFLLGFFLVLQKPYFSFI